MKVSYDSNRNMGGSNISCSIAIMALSPMAEIVNELDTTGRYRIIFCDIPSALRAELKLEILSKFCQEQRLLYSQGDRNGRHAYRTNAILSFRSKTIGVGLLSRRHIPGGILQTVSLRNPILLSI